MTFVQVSLQGSIRRKKTLNSEWVRLVRDEYTAMFHDF